MTWLLDLLETTNRFDQYDPVPQSETSLSQCFDTVGCFTPSLDEWEGSLEKLSSKSLTSKSKVLPCFDGTVNGDAIECDGSWDGRVSLHLNHHCWAKLSLEIGAIYRIPEWRRRQAWFVYLFCLLTGSLDKASLQLLMQLRMTLDFWTSSLYLLSSRPKAPPCPLMQ